MIKGFIIRQTEEAKELSDRLLSRDLFKDIVALDSMLKSDDFLAVCDPEIVCVEQSIGWSAISDASAKFGWKSFRLGTLEIQTEGGRIKFIVCFTGKLAEIFTDDIFTRTLTEDEIAAYIDDRVKRVRGNSALKALKSFLAKIGIYSNLKGYNYIIEAFEESIKDRNLLNSLTNELYPSIAQKFGTNARSVERDMRNAIEVSYNRGKFFEVANAIGGNFTKYEKPSNGEFIAFLVDTISILLTSE